MRVNREWISISDMMAGLMMVFLFIAVALMMVVREEQNTIKEIVFTYREYQEALHHDLMKEFSGDLKKWDAEILKDNTIRFKSPEVLFRTNESQITTEFQKILDDFFPRYIKVLTSQKYKNEVDEVRIEGHTSSTWTTNTSTQDRYLNNMRLSQDRAKAVLEYCYRLKSIEEEQSWLNHTLRANGLSYAKRIYNEDGTENFQRSQRVEFKVLTKAEEKIFNIIEAIE